MSAITFIQMFLVASAATGLFFVAAIGTGHLARKVFEWYKRKKDEH